MPWSSYKRQWIHYGPWMIQKPENAFFKSGLVAACALNGVGKPWGPRNWEPWMMGCLEIGLGQSIDPRLHRWPWSFQALHIFFLMIQMFVFYRVSRLHQDEVAQVFEVWKKRGARKTTDTRFLGAIWGSSSHFAPLSKPCGQRDLWGSLRVPPTGVTGFFCEKNTRAMVYANLVTSRWEQKSSTPCPSFLGKEAGLE